MRLKRKNANMADVKWIKLMVDVFSNRKIDQIEVMPEGDGIIVIWFKLLCLAGSINDDGAIYFTKELPYTEEMLAAQFRRPIQLVRLALRVFTQFGMIEIVEDIIHISNWAKYQNTDRMKEIREYNRIAKQKSRERKRLMASSDVNDMSMTSQSCQGTEEEEDIDIEVEVDKTKSKRVPAVRHKHGQYGWVLLTDAQMESLERDLGQIELARCIAYVDESAQSTNNKNKWKDWNLVIRRCSRDNWGKAKSKTSTLDILNRMANE